MVFQNQRMDSAERHTSLTSIKVPVLEIIENLFKAYLLIILDALGASSTLPASAPAFHIKFKTK